MQKHSTKTKLLAYFLFFAIAFQSCTTYKSYWVAPQFTNVAKITQLKAGMTTEEINRTLGTQPYDVYHIQQDGSSVIVYNYRIKDRRMTVPTEPLERERVLRNEERGQTEGEVWYQEDFHKVYVLLKDNKMKSLITDNGYENSQFLLLQNNSIQLISKNELTSLNNSGSKTTDGNSDSVVLPLKKDAPKTMQNTMQNKSKAGKILMGVLGVVLLISLIGLVAEEA